MQNQHVAVAQKKRCASDSFVPCSLHLLFLSVRFIPNKHLLLVSLETRLLSDEGKILFPARTCQHPEKVIELLSPRNDHWDLRSLVQLTVSWYLLSSFTPKILIIINQLESHGLFWACSWISSAPDGAST